MRDPMLILHFLGLAMGVGTSFAFMFLGMAAAKLGPQEGPKFMINASVVSKMGHIGILVLILTGGYLMTPYWKVLGQMPLMIAKLALVLVLAALIGIMSAALRKAKNGDLAQLGKTKTLGPISLLVSIAIVVLAVLQFH